MNDLLTSLQNLLVACWDVLVSLIEVVLPFMPLIAWVVFWLFAVNWIRLRSVMLAGGWIGLLLIGLVMILVWGTVAPPASGTHSLLGLHVSNFVGKTVLVTGLFCIMFLCGAVQLSGFSPACCSFEEEPVQLAVTDAHASHGSADTHADSHGHAHH